MNPSPFIQQSWLIALELTPKEKERIRRNVKHSLLAFRSSSGVIALESIQKPSALL